jgi:phosphatidylglycerophosphatase A
VKRLSTLCSTAFGIGYLPFIPGTWASLAAALLYKIILFRFGGSLFALLIVLFFLLGTLSAGVSAGVLEHKDPRPVVIDEVCGQWIALFLVPATWTNVVIGFLLFRAFDVVKPFPIRKLEGLPRGWGIMADDVLAGVFSAVILHGYLLLK